MVDGWRSNIRFSSAHIIPEYEKCGRLHGHTYAVHAKVFGTPDDKGIIVDFSAFKEVLKQIINKLDHRVLIPEKSKYITIKKEGKSLQLISNGEDYVFPLKDCILLPIDSTSAENLSNYILDKLIKRNFFQKNIDKVEIGVDEGFGQGARISKKYE